MNFNPYIYILYYQSLLNYLPLVSYPYKIKIKYFICNGGVGTAREQNWLTLHYGDM